MSQAHKHNSISTGLAMFSMFFGAGNVVFPLAIGQSAQQQTFFAMLGLALTGVIVPFVGLISMTLFRGDYHQFFGRVGRWPGFLTAVLCMTLIGPLGALPRTVTLSYSTIHLYTPGLSLPIFSALSCMVIFFFTYRKRRILDVLGYVLTPILLISLMVIIVKGCWMGGTLEASTLSSSGAFMLGLTEGYNTMDLMGALFFSSVVLNCLMAEQPEGHEPNYKVLTWVTFKASLVGASLLALVYSGFSLVAALHQQAITDVPLDQLIARLGLHILGPAAGVIASLAVALACLTTAIALASVFAEFLKDDILNDKLSYRWCLIITLLVMFGMTNLEFSGIVSLTAPILLTIYPALIGLSLLNIAYKLSGFRPVKLPVSLILAAACLYSLVG